jgi:hypothetical protein
LYVDEQAFRFNRRKGTDGIRFRAVLDTVTGRRLTRRSRLASSRWRRLVDIGKKKRPPESEEHSRFKNLLRKIVAVPKKEADEKMAELRERRSEWKPGHKL